MSRKLTYSRCQTLRLDPRLDDLLAEAAFEHRISKASYVRAALHHQLGTGDERHGRMAHDRRSPAPAMR